jgi:hypothetical protein
MRKSGTQDYLPDYAAPDGAWEIVAAVQTALQIRQPYGLRNRCKSVQNWSLLTNTPTLRVLSKRSSACWLFIDSINLPLNFINSNPRGRNLYLALVGDKMKYPVNNEQSKDILSEL